MPLTDDSAPIVTLTDAPDPQETAVIADNLRATTHRRPAATITAARHSGITGPLNTREVLGGFMAACYLGQLRVDRFFLPRRCAATGSAAVSLAMAEEEGRRRGCTRIALNTLEIQAPGFYQKQGYEIAATLTHRRPASPAT
jgi:hypothetical protein